MDSSVIMSWTLPSKHFLTKKNKFGTKKKINVFLFLLFKA